MIDVDKHGIETLPSGKFRVRFIRKGRSVSKVVATIDEAVGIRNAIRDELTSGDVVPLEGISAAGWGPTWLRDFRSSNRGFKTERGRFDLHISTADWATKPLRAVESPDIIAWLMKLQKTRAIQNGKTLKRTLGFQTRKHVRNLAKALFTDAVGMGLCKTNPVIGVKVKKTANDSLVERVPEEWPLKPQEQHTIVDVLKDNPERWIILFAMGTGLRQGEQWNLHTADVHLDEPEPFINVRYGSKGRPPKNGRPRKVPLFGMALEAARSWLECLPAYAPSNPEGLMFPTPYKAKKQESGGRRYKGAHAVRWARDTSRVEGRQVGAWSRASGLVALASPHGGHLSSLRMVGTPMVAQRGEHVARAFIGQGYGALRPFARLRAGRHRRGESRLVALSTIERSLGGIIGHACPHRRMVPRHRRLAAVLWRAKSFSMAFP